MNVLLIVSEHHNPQFVGCYGNPISHTPNIDRLSAEGTRFEYTYCASPLCVPARGALFSGLYPHETGVWCNATPWNGRGGWARHLRDQGVHIATVGKLDFQPECDHGISDEMLPRHRASLDIHSLYREREIIPRFQNLKWIRASRRREDYPETTPDTETLDRSVRWLREDRPTDRPWVLNVNFLKVHPVWAPPPKEWDRFDPLVKLDQLPEKYFHDPKTLHPYFRAFRHLECGDYVQADDIRRAHVGFHAFCHMLDGYVGRLLDELDELGLTDDTMVIYTTDHGANVHAHGCWSLMNLWEDSARVPLIVRHPHGRAGRTDGIAAHHHDIFPTICDAMDVAPLRSVRGQSLLPSIVDESPRSAGCYVLCEVHANGWPASCFAVSDGRWKVIECVNERPVVFCLAEDPQELHDLAVERPEDPEVIQAIRRAQSWLQQVCDPQAVDARAKADQAALRRHLAQTGQLAQELHKRGYEPVLDHLVPRQDLLDELQVRWPA